MISDLLIFWWEVFYLFKYFIGDDYVNTTGFIRGYMSKNMKTEDFIGVVVSALNREFEEIKNGVKLDKINDDFIVAIDEYKLTLSKALIDRLKSPYGVDKYILEEFEKQGFNFDKNRSQYIQYCFGNYVGTQVL